MDNNIRALRTERGWTMRELAERMSTEGAPVHFSTIAKIERSQRGLSAAWAKRFAQVFEVTPAEISPEFAELGGKPGTPAQQIPVIGMVAAGNWREAVQETDSYIAGPASGKNAFGLVVSGQSMNKIAPEGSVVMVDPDQMQLHDGAYYVVMNGESDATFKQYRSNPARLEPCSTSDEYKTIMLGADAFTVVGRVVGVYQQL